MAWRLTPFQSMVANATVITADLLNTIQAAVNDLFNGAYSVKKLFVDGTGDQAASYAAGIVAKITGGAVQADGASGDPNPVLVTTVTPSARKLLWRIFHLSGGGVTGDLYCRLYIDATNNAISFVFNASWSTPNWTLDEPTQPAYRILLGWGTKSIAYQSYAPGAATFAEGAWTDALVFNGTSFSSLTAGWLKATTARSSATLGAGQAVAAGEVWKDTTVIAWGRFSIGGGAISAVSRAVNIKAGGITYVSTGRYKVELQTPPTNNMVVAPAIAVNQAAFISYVPNDGAGYFEIYVINAAGSPTDTTEVSFIVTGG